MLTPPRRRLRPGPHEQPGSVSCSFCPWVKNTIPVSFCFPGKAKRMPARALLGCLVLAAYSVPAAQGHTWMFTKGRAWMQASLDKPFRQRILEGGQGTHAQLGPGQSMVVRWATSHNNTFKLAVVAGKDQDWFYHKDFFAMFHDYIDSAPPGANEAVQKPRYHGAAGKSGYTNHDTYTACAGGYCVNNLFSRQLPTTDPACAYNFKGSLPSCNLSRLSPLTSCFFRYFPHARHGRRGRR